MEWDTNVKNANGKENADRSGINALIHAIPVRP